MNTKPVLTRLIAGALVATFTCAQADAATILVRCDKRVNRSSISVDGNNLVARFLRCRAQSGINLRTTRLKRTVGDELECDFDSNLNDYRGWRHSHSSQLHPGPAGHGEAHQPLRPHGNLGHLHMPGPLTPL
ncbi:MAG: hypothetical protein H0V34_03285 [Gammaproteobacteria bacterium]|nr:hypothetical protein [Gammaproteobacteria bacterium]